MENGVKKHLQIMEMTSKILSLTFEKKSLKEVLQKALEIVLSAQWLSAHKDGCIFVVNEEIQSLEMLANVGLRKFVIENCLNVAKGKCLCGKVYENGLAIFKSHIDEEHQVRYEGITDHGHYIMPIAITGIILGVLNIYTKAGYKQSKTDLDFLTIVSDLLAQIIYKTKLNEKILALKEIDGKMSGMRDIRMHHSFLLDEICRVTGWEIGEVWRPDMDRKTLYCFANSAVNKYEHCDFPMTFNDLKFKKGEDIVGAAWESGDCVWIRNIAENKKIIKREVPLSCEIKSGFAFPLFVSGEIYVILSFFSKENKIADEDLIEHVKEVFVKIGMSLRQNMIFDQLMQIHKMEAIGSLATGVAHDFNNILGAILGYCEILSLGLKEKSKQLSYVSEIEKIVKKASGITGQLLTFSRKKPAIKSIVNVNNSIKELSAMLQKIIGKTIELELNLNESAGEINIAPSQLDQILMNIVINAKDASKGRGKIKIETGGADLSEKGAPIDLPHGKYCLISISDDGQGMDDFVKDKIFMPFFTTKEKGKGTGIGLAVVYSVLKENNAELIVESKMGEGTKFNFYFPKVG